jgi:hypothetical protein
MPVDCVRPTKPVLVHVDPEEWSEFRKLVGSRMASRRIRALIRVEIERQIRVNRSTQR